MKILLPGIITTLCLTPSLILAAESSTRNLVDVSQCVVIQDNNDRYTCFDNITEHLRTQEPQINQTVQEDQRVQQTAENNEKKGLSIFRFLRRDAEEVAESESVKEIVTNNNEEETLETFGRRTSRLEENSTGENVLYDRIVSLREREPSQYLITLESGQVWYQTVNKRYRLKEQMEVIISLSPIGGSYRLSSPEANGFIQVRRIE